jgi:hypothetical protein
MLCEQRLIHHLNTDNFSMMCHYADIYNANRLKEYCAWFHRVHPSIDIHMYGEDQSQFSFLEKQAKSSNQPSASLMVEGPVSCSISDSGVPPMFSENQSEAEGSVN